LKRLFKNRLIYMLQGMSLNITKLVVLM